MIKTHSGSKKIIIFDGTFRTTTFINRRAAVMAKENRVYILGFNETLNKKVEGVRYVALGSNQNVLRLIGTSFWTVLQSGKLWLLFPTLFSMITGNRKQLQQQNLDLSLKRIQPDEIHLQWPSVIPWFEKVLEHQTYPVFLWQRGYHINVRPFVDSENMAYLQKWFPKMAGFISVSQAISDVGDKIWHSPEKNNAIVYTTLPLTNYPFLDSYKRDRPIKILSVGRNHWKKGYTYGLYACSILKKRGIPFTYTIIGASGNEELIQIRHDLNLVSEVCFLDSLSHSEVIGAMQSASILLLPSIEEGLPNVVIEAMALGLPVMAAEIGGISEVIIHGENGFHFPSRDPQAIADVVSKFLNMGDDEIETLRKQGRETVEKISQNRF